MDNNTKVALANLQEVQYKLGIAQDEVKGAKKMYDEAVIDETINNILTILKDDGTVTKRDLQIFLRDLVDKVGR